jgi:hypothetical protein
MPRRHGPAKVRRVVPGIVALVIGLAAVLTIGLGAPLAAVFRGAWAAYLAIALGAALGAVSGSIWAAHFSSSPVTAGNRLGAAALGVLGAFSLASGVLQALLTSQLTFLSGWDLAALLITLLGFVFYPFAALMFLLKRGWISRSCLIVLSVIVSALWYVFWFWHALSPFPVRIRGGWGEALRVLSIASVAVPLCFAAVLAGDYFRRALGDRPYAWPRVRSRA